MAGFRSLARQVRDPRADLALRRYSLRKCLERFAPYGHRATWDHLCARHGFGPEDRAPDPARLTGALAELEAARALWLAYEAGFAERRRREKHEGLRRPGSFDAWHRRIWGGNGVARCADPGTHPSAPLPEVLHRLIAALDAEPGTACPVCAETRIVWRQDVRPGPRSGPECTGCGILLPQSALTPGTLARAHRIRHQQLTSAA
ncbi:hypothetical protein OG233_25575 [Streptomyces sp. NBC_01218]|uniref:hypothetical protein n=1 Tax=unclassified Streptomyces TaxID=2593676 RepID=UPI0023B9C3E1|nr:MULTISPECIES: hypothetical protein [unclassified Streptomyces]WEH42624.1 hypothetical protein PZB77_25735 [Streptomyces sp. AM 2-1-1]WSQ54248.1 hypothetical protein OG233_25575 [Streptomyces sp. NBC_01218]